MVGEKDTGTNSTLWTVLAGLGIEHKDPKYLPLQFTRGLKDLKVKILGETVVNGWSTPFASS